ncbi:QueT transporter family protein [Clostridium sardiniense]|uniref:QueT transporter family protein n=1 Tax=Clostridium sardiniense TaxID=29369 RepID=UPI003D3538F6
MIKNSSLDIFVKIAVVAAIYVVLTVAIAPISYGPIQVRISEILVLLAFYDKRYIVSLTIGCLFSNILSPLGMADIIVGTLGTFFSVYAISKTKNLFIATLWPMIFCIPVVGTLHLLIGLPFWIYLFGFMIGEFISVTIVGYPIVKLISKNSKLISIIQLT